MTIPLCLLAIVLLNGCVVAIATRNATNRARATAAAPNVVVLAGWRSAQPHTDSSTLVALPGSGRVVDSEA